MKFEFIEKEKPQKIWVNETEAHKYLDALIKANPICFREYIEKVKADAIDEFLELIEKRITESNHGLYLIDAMSFAEQLKEQ